MLYDRNGMLQNDQFSPFSINLHFITFQDRISLQQLLVLKKL